MKKYRVFAILFLTLAMVVVAACGSGGAQAPQVDWTLNVEGEVDAPLTLSYADLAAMEQVQLSQVLMQKSRGEDTVNDWEGVPLAAILEQAGAQPDASGVTASAADGYAIMVSMADLEDAIVALKMDGEWIGTSDPDHGPIRLVVPNKPSNHWVFALTDIIVEGAGALPPSVEWELGFEGAMDNERTFEYVQLSSLETVLLEGVVVQTRTGESTHDFEGVALITLFDLVAAHSDAQGITATAADGYSVAIPMTDLGRDAIVALKMDGEWLAVSDPESPIRLVVPGLPANQWVSQLVTIKVEAEVAEAPEEPELPAGPEVEWELTIGGAVDDETTFSYADLLAMEMTTLEDVVMQTRSGESTHDFEGIALTTFFEAVGAQGDAQGIAATACDGYSVSISIADLGEDAVVGLKMDGEWLAVSDPESPMRLVVPGLPANQWVGQLVSITVE